MRRVVEFSCQGLGCRVQIALLLSNFTFRVQYRFCKRFVIEGVVVAS